MASASTACFNQLGSHMTVSRPSRCLSSLMKSMFVLSASAELGVRAKSTECGRNGGGGNSQGSQEVCARQRKLPAFQSTDICVASMARICRRVCPRSPTERLDLSRRPNAHSGSSRLAASKRMAINHAPTSSMCPREDECAIKDTKRQLEFESSHASQHLAQLRAAIFVTTREVGSQVFHALRAPLSGDRFGSSSHCSRPHDVLRARRVRVTRAICSRPRIPAPRSNSESCAKEAQ